MTQETAIEWLIEQLKEYGWADIKDSQNWIIRIDALILTAKVEQAKQMEKEQIVEAFYEGMKTNPFDPNRGRGKMYYDETYKKQ